MNTDMNTTTTTPEHIPNPEVLEFDKLCQDYINALYQGISGFISYQPGEKEANEKNNVFLTYGEILYPSVNKIIDYIGDIGPDDVFYDLGSGIGKVALQLFLKTPIKKACGVEASQTRNQYAEKVYEQVKKEFPDLYLGGRELSCKRTNFLEAGIHDATIIYTCSTCFSEDLLAEIGKLIDQCPNIRYVVSMKQIPSRVPYDTAMDIECTWDKTKCHVYSFVQKGANSLEKTEELPV